MLEDCVKTFKIPGTSFSMRDFPAIFLRISQKTRISLFFKTAKRLYIVLKTIRILANIMDKPQ